MGRLTVHGELKKRHTLASPTGKPIISFAYSVPQLTAASLRPQIDAYIAQKLFPPVL